MKYKGLYDDAILYPDYANTIDDFILTSRSCLTNASSEGRVKKAETNSINWSSLCVKRSKSQTFNTSERKYDLEITIPTLSEIHLWRAVLVRAINDLTLVGGREADRLRYRREAVRYIKNDSYTVGSYRYACEVVGVDPKKLRIKLKGVLE